MLKIPKFVKIPRTWKPIGVQSVYDAASGTWRSVGQTIKTNCAAGDYKIFAFFLLPVSRTIITMGKHPSIKSRYAWVARTFCHDENARYSR